MATSGSYVAKIAFREVLQSVFRYKWKMLLVFVTVSAASVVGVMLMPNYFQSDAMLIVQPGREYAAVDASGFDAGRLNSSADPWNGR